MCCRRLCCRSGAAHTSGLVRVNQNPLRHPSFVFCSCYCSGHQHQLLVVSYCLLLVVCYQLSVIYHWLSVIRYQIPVVGNQQSVICHWSSSDLEISGIPSNRSTLMIPRGRTAITTRQEKLYNLIFD